MKDNKGYTDIAKKMGEEIEHTAKALEKKGLPERTASYAAMMAYLRSKRK